MLVLTFFEGGGMPKRPPNPRARYQQHQHSCLQAPMSGRARSNPDSVIVLSWVPAHLSRSIDARRLVTVMRKSECCRCGCSGRCTVQALFRVFTWSFNCLAAGTWPSTGPFGEALERGRPGRRLGVKGTLAAHQP